MKGKINLVSLFILTLLSVILLVSTITVNYKNVDNVQKIELNRNKFGEPVKLINFKINPGEEIIYRFYYDGEVDKEYPIEIWFESVDESLDELLFVYAKYDNLRTKESSVYSFNENNKLKFDFEKNSKYKYFELVFYMPEDIGNEAQNLKFDFKTYVDVKVW